MVGSRGQRARISIVVRSCSGTHVVAGVAAYDVMVSLASPVVTGIV